MGIYRYEPTSLIDEITIATTENGAERAYLHAGKNASSEKLHDVTCALAKQGWECIPFIHNGKPTLEVRGFGKSNKLRNLLKTNEWLTGSETFDKSNDTQLGFWEKIKKNSLFASGVLMIGGDLGFIKYGLKEASKEDVLAGLFYALGTWSLVGYGRNDQSDLQIKDIAKKVSAEITQKGVMPANCSIRELLDDKPKSPLENTHELLRRYPSETFNLLTGIAGMFVAIAALKHKALAKLPATMSAGAQRKLRLEGWMDVGLGTTTMAATAIGGLIKEKQPDPNKPPAKGPMAALEYVQQHPLSVTGYGLMISSLCHAASTVVAYKEAKRVGDTKRLASVPYRGLFVVANLLAEMLISISSKGHGEGVQSDETIDHSVYALTADLISKNPAHSHEKLIKYMANYLADPQIMGGEATEIERALRQQLQGMVKNPWSEYNDNAQSKAVEPAQEKEVAVVPTPAPVQAPESKLTYSETITRKAEITPAPAFANWKEKVAAPASEIAPQASLI